MSNPNKIIIDLPGSNGFSTRNDRHVAEIVLHEVQQALREHTSFVCTARIAPEDVPAASSTAVLKALYQRLLDMHMKTVLTHGAQVGQGLALAIKEIHQLLPADTLNPALQEWAENTAASAETVQEKS